MRLSSSSAKLLRAVDPDVFSESGSDAMLVGGGDVGFWRRLEGVGYLLSGRRGACGGLLLVHSRYCSWSEIDMAR